MAVAHDHGDTLCPITRLVRRKPKLHVLEGYSPVMHTHQSSILVGALADGQNGVGIVIGANREVGVRILDLDRFFAKEAGVADQNHVTGLGIFHGLT